MKNDLNEKIAQLKEMSAGIVDDQKCKKALLLSNMDVEKAHQWLMRNTNIHNGKQFYEGREKHGQNIKRK